MWGTTRRLTWLGCALAVACASDDSRKPGPGKDVTVDPGKPVQLTAAAGADYQALTRQVNDVSKLSTDDLLAQHALTQTNDLGYDPSTAAGLDAIAASKLSLDDAEQQLLRQNGFVVSARQNFNSMLAAYEAIYVADLPVYVSADSMLDAVHLSYDSILRDVELSQLIGDLTKLLTGMRAALPSYDKDPAAADADLFLSIAHSLLTGKLAAPVAGAKNSDVEAFIKAAQLASGTSDMTLFGTKRQIDFSQFTPRGHYVDTPELTQYFRAMMWLGRVDLRLIETMPTGEQVFQRRQLDAMLLLRKLIDDNGLARWTELDDTMQAFVGKSDYMRVSEIDALLNDLGVDRDGVAKLSDQIIAQTIIDKGYGTQLIASQLIVNDSDKLNLPLDRSFALLGQRYVIDSHVFSKLVYDRIPGRMMPNPLDVAYAALGNDAAAPLLKSELEQYHYAGALEGTRVLVEGHGDDYWISNLYTSWLGALRGLSPRAAEVMDPGKAGLPAVTGTEAWGRRLLSTQLASWAELRHDTILYAKQSYTSGVSCEYPDAYVEPYPAVFAALEAFAQRGLSSVNALSANGPLKTTISDYFTRLQAAAGKLKVMAEAQRTGTPFSGEQLAFINEAVHSYRPQGCGGPRSFDGWFAKLIYGVGDDGKIASEFKPTIADVHTQPTDDNGVPVGKILHVGTGKTRLMVVTVDTCRGPRAYAGPVTSYYEVITKDFERLTDQGWTERLQTSGSADVPWTSTYVRP